MTVRRYLPPALFAVVAIAAAIVIAGAGDSDPYKVRVQLDNASGLRSGRAVKIDGAKVGEVGDIAIGRRDVVVADLDIERKYAPIGRGASVAIQSTNLLGEKFVTLGRGDRSRPEPSGAVIPQSRVTTPVDLDQVIDVLDAPTRARLGILINEAGLGLTGRRLDFNALLKELPPSLQAATKLLDEVVSDRRTVATLVSRSERFVTRFAAERKRLGAMIDAAGGTMESLASRRQRLAETLSRAPATLRTLRGFLARLEGTARLLGPASGAISASVPPLSRTLDEVEPFRRAAEPALEQAVRTGPQLTRLADGATPVIRRANPALGQLARLARELAPVTRTLDRAVADVYGLLEGWGRATQTRDGLSHVFRGHALFSLDTIRSALARITPKAKARRRVSPRRPDRSTRSPAPAARQERRPALKAPTLPSIRLPGLPGIELPKNLSLPDAGGVDDRAHSLLDFLLAP